MRFSSHFTHSNCHASLLPGPPSVYPRHDWRGAWRPFGGDLHPWVELGFPRVVEVTHVRVWETIYPGGLVAIKARENNKGEAWTTLWEGGAGRLFKSRIFCPELQRRCRADAVRLELAGDYYRGLDAVEIEGVAMTSNQNNDASNQTVSCVIS